MTNLNPKFEDLGNSETFKKHLDGLLEALDGNPGDIPQFPIQVFPKPIQEIIQEVAQHLNFPIDFTSGAILFTTSIAIGNGLKVQMKNNWEESAAVYMVLIGPPGTNKSHPLSFALKPLMDKDNQSYQKYEKELRRYEEESALSTRERESLNISPPVRPELKKFIISDSTLEAIAATHKINPNGIGLYVDEFAGWLKNFNRYNKGSDQENWLSLWSNKPIIIDRKGSIPIRIDSPFISVCGTIQTAILDKMAQESRDGNGFIDRILMVFPQGLTAKPWSDTDLDILYKQRWENIIAHIVDEMERLMFASERNLKLISFTADAKKLLYTWQNHHTTRINREEDHTIKGILSKLEIYCIRFSLLLSCLGAASTQAPCTIISIDAVQGAILLTEYFIATATKVNQIIAYDDPLEQLTEKQKLFYNALPKKFTTAEAISKGREVDYAERTVKRFLKKKNLFKRVKTGNYQKLE